MDYIKTKTADSLNSFKCNTSFDSVEQELKDRVANIDLTATICSELSKNKRFSLHELSDEIILYFNHGERGPSKIHVGFPFPLQSSNQFISQNHLKLDLFIRGEPVRKIQRQILANNSSEYSTVPNFPDFVKNNVVAADRIIYLDPYEYIGDSFISLYFLDSFKKAFNIHNSVVFSQQYKHLAAETASLEYTPEAVAKELKPNDLILAPDLIDTHWTKTLQTIREVSRKKVQFLIPGRGLFVDMDSNNIKVYHSGKEDTLLMNKNIEDYMSDCLKVFGIEGQAIFGEQQFPNTSRFFFNPFASQELRYISAELAFYTYKQLKEMNKTAEFYLIAGYHKNRTHTEWLNSFLSLLKDDGCMRRISINYYSDLSELAEHLAEKECSAILTADTSISHVANRFGYPNITTHNPIWWDANSLQSLSASSPAGFGRYTRNQIPIINDAYTVEETKRIAELSANALLFFQKKPSEQKRIFESGQANWINDMYSPATITNGIKDDPKGEFIRSAAVKVSAEYKLRNLT